MYNEEKWNARRCLNRLNRLNVSEMTDDERTLYAVCNYYLTADKPIVIERSFGVDTDRRHFWDDAGAGHYEGLILARQDAADC